MSMQKTNAAACGLQQQHLHVLCLQLLSAVLFVCLLCAMNPACCALLCSLLTLACLLRNCAQFVAKPWREPIAIAGVTPHAGQSHATWQAASRVTDHL